MPRQRAPSRPRAQEAPRPRSRSQPAIAQSTPPALHAQVLKHSVRAFAEKHPTFLADRAGVSAAALKQFLDEVRQQAKEKGLLAQDVDECVEETKMKFPKKVRKALRDSGDGGRDAKKKDAVHKSDGVKVDDGPVRQSKTPVPLPLPRGRTPGPSVTTPSKIETPVRVPTFDAGCTPVPVPQFKPHNVAEKEAAPAVNGHTEETKRERKGKQKTKALSKPIKQEKESSPELESAPSAPVPKAKPPKVAEKGSTTVLNKHTEEPKPTKKGKKKTDIPAKPIKKEKAATPELEPEPPKSQNKRKRTLSDDGTAHPPQPASKRSQSSPRTTASQALHNELEREVIQSNKTTLFNMRNVIEQLDATSRPVTPAKSKMDKDMATTLSAPEATSEPAIAAAAKSKKDNDAATTSGPDATDEIFKFTANDKKSTHKDKHSQNDRKSKLDRKHKLDKKNKARSHHHHHQEALKPDSPPPKKKHKSKHTDEPEPARESSASTKAAEDESTKYLKKKDKKRLEKEKRVAEERIVEADMPPPPPLVHEADIGNASKLMAKEKRRMKKEKKEKQETEMRKCGELEQNQEPQISAASAHIELEQAVPHDSGVDAVMVQEGLERKKNHHQSTKGKREVEETVVEPEPEPKPHTPKNKRHHPSAGEKQEVEKESAEVENAVVEQLEQEPKPHKKKNKKKHSIKVKEPEVVEMPPKIETGTAGPALSDREHLVADTGEDDEMVVDRLVPPTLDENHGVQTEEPEVETAPVETETVSALAVPGDKEHSVANHGSEVSLPAHQYPVLSKEQKVERKMRKKEKKLQKRTEQRIAKELAQQSSSHQNQAHSPSLDSNEEAKTEVDNKATSISEEPMSLLTEPTKKQEDEAEQEPLQNGDLLPVSEPLAMTPPLKRKRSPSPSPSDGISDANATLDTQAGAASDAPEPRLSKGQRRRARLAAKKRKLVEEVAEAQMSGREDRGPGSECQPELEPEPEAEPVAEPEPEVEPEPEFISEPKLQPPKTHETRKRDASPSTIETTQRPVKRQRKLSGRAVRHHLDTSASEDNNSVDDSFSPAAPRRTGITNTFSVLLAQQNDEDDEDQDRTEGWRSSILRSSDVRRRTSGASSVAGSARKRRSRRASIQDEVDRQIRRDMAARAGDKSEGVKVEEEDSEENLLTMVLRRERELYDLEQAQKKAKAEVEAEIVTPSSEQDDSEASEEASVDGASEAESGVPVDLDSNIRSPLGPAQIPLPESRSASEEGSASSAASDEEKVPDEQEAPETEEEQESGDSTEQDDDEEEAAEEEEEEERPWFTVSFSELQNEPIADANEKREDTDIEEEIEDEQMEPPSELEREALFGEDESSSEYEESIPDEPNSEGSPVREIESEDSSVDEPVDEDLAVDKQSPAKNNNVSRKLSGQWKLPIPDEPDNKDSPVEEPESEDSSVDEPISENLTVNKQSPAQNNNWARKLSNQWQHLKSSFSNASQLSGSRKELLDGKESDAGSVAVESESETESDEESSDESQEEVDEEEDERKEGGEGVEKSPAAGSRRSASRIDVQTQGPDQMEVATMHQPVQEHEANPPFALRSTPETRGSSYEKDPPGFILPQLNGAIDATEPQASLSRHSSPSSRESSYEIEPKGFISQDAPPTTPRRRTGLRSNHFPSQRPPPGTVSRLPFPEVSAPRFGLVQEDVCDDPFRLIIAVTFLNKTSGEVAIPVFWDFMAHYPTPTDLAHANLDDVVGILRRVGLQNVRAKTLIKFAQGWLEQPPMRGYRSRTLNYPKKGSGKDIRPREVLYDADPRDGAFEIVHLAGCRGPYALDSWRIFCRDALRGVALGWDGEGVGDAGFEPEWRRVLPRDKELKSFVRWLWLREGWDWDINTGERKPAEGGVGRIGKWRWDQERGVEVRVDSDGEVVSEDEEDQGEGEDGVEDRDDDGVEHEYTDEGEHEDNGEGEEDAEGDDAAFAFAEDVRVDDAQHPQQEQQQQHQHHLDASPRPRPRPRLSQSSSTRRPRSTSPLVVVEACASAARRRPSGQDHELELDDAIPPCSRSRSRSSRHCVPPAHELELELSPSSELPELPELPGMAPVAELQQQQQQQQSLLDGTDDIDTNTANMHTHITRPQENEHEQEKEPENEKQPDQDAHKPEAEKETHAPPPSPPPHSSSSSSSSSPPSTPPLPRHRRSSIIPETPEAVVFPEGMEASKRARRPRAADAEELGEGDWLLGVLFGEDDGEDDGESDGGEGGGDIGDGSGGRGEGEGERVWGKEGSVEL